MSKMHTTLIDLPETTRQKCVQILNDNLATAVHLTLQAKQAHWNVRGPHFFALHGLFDKVYAAASEWVDALAERVGQLGAPAEAGLDVVQKRSKLPAFGVDVVEGPDHVAAVARALSIFGKAVRAAIDATAQAGDATTADLCTEISGECDKMLWFVEAHQQAAK